MPDKPGIFAELQRRHVWRVAIAYAVAGWLLIQIATQVFPFFGIPDWGVRLVVVLIVIAFPIALILTWVYELTPEGVRRTVPADSPEARPEHEGRQIGRKLNTVIITVLIIAVALLGWRLLVLGHAPAVEIAANPSTASSAQYPATRSPVGTAPASFDPPDESIVVLPFANMSDDPKQKYFTNGITEELTNALGQNTGLTVIAWHTASRFADNKHSPREIGETLNVAHILGGSIQRAGEEVRVSVELVSTVTGQQLWSEQYDDSLKNIFAVQDRITAAIARALEVKFAGMHAAPTLNPRAHDLYLKGIEAVERSTVEDTRAAQGYFQQALKLDPDYADAWAGLASTYHQLSQFSTLPLEQALPKARAAAEKALALDPHNVNALRQLGIAYLQDNRIEQARQAFAQAVKLDPSSADAHRNYALVLPVRQAMAHDRAAARLNPDDVNAQNNLTVDYLNLADWPGMVAAASALNRLSPRDINAAFYLAFAYARLQRGEDAIKAFDLVQPDTALDRKLVDAGRLTYRALRVPALRPEALAALDGLRQAKLSPFSRADLMQLYLALGEKATVMQMLSGFCPSDPAGCGDLAVNPMYGPLRGDPRFEKLAKQYTTMTLE